MREIDLSDVRAILGRDLSVSETETYSSLDEISAAVEAVTATLADHDVIIACKYLHERVPRSRLSMCKVKVEELTQRDRS